MCSGHALITPIVFHSFLELTVLRDIDVHGPAWIDFLFELQEIFDLAITIRIEFTEHSHRQSVHD